MMGVGALRTLAAARKTLALVVLLLTCGGLLLALLGGRAEHLLLAASSDDALPRLVSLLLPSAVAPAGLLVLFGAALTGAVAEVMVCTFILNEQVAARRRGRDGSVLGVAAIRLQMACIAMFSGGVALADPHVVALVLTAFRVFVPGLVPQAVLALLGQRTRASAVVASMILGPATSLAVAWARPGWQETLAEPALWGTLVAVGIMALGHLREAPARFHKQ
jgi:Na+/proline symporter